VRSLGFVHEGFSREFLHLPGPDGRRAWRDHDRYTMVASDWPAVPYRPHATKRLAVVVSGPPALTTAGPTTAGLAAQLAAELGLPLYSAATVEPTSTLFELLRSSPVGGVIEARVGGPELRMGLARAGFDPAVVPVTEPPAALTRADVVRQALIVRAAFATARA
jgi:ribosomal-protein-alanine N-acetyltransferase